MLGLWKSVMRCEKIAQMSEVLMIGHGGNDPASTLWMYGMSGRGLIRILESKFEIKDS